MASYTITVAAGGGLALLRNGIEIGLVPDANAASGLAAGDMLARYPEVTSDLMVQAAREVGRDLADAVHVEWFAEVLAEHVKAAWDEARQPA